MLRLIVVFTLMLFSHSLLADAQEQAEVLLTQGKVDDAIQLLRRQIDGQPNDLDAKFLLGVALAENGQRDAAIEVFNGLVNDHPQLPEPHNNLAVLHAQTGDYDSARASLEKAIKTHPSYATAHENLGDVYGFLAQQAYDQALKLDQDSSALQVKLDILRRLSAVSMPEAVPPKEQETASSPEVADSAEPIATPVVDNPDQAEPAEVANDLANTELEVLRAVEIWANAWSAQDVNAYLSAYSKTFETPSGLSRDVWRLQRRSRIAKPQFIRVGVNDPRVQMLSDSLAMVTFYQIYEASNFSDESAKALLMNKEDGRWLIAKEETVATR